MGGRIGGRAQSARPATARLPDVEGGGGRLEPRKTITEFADDDFGFSVFVADARAGWHSGYKQWKRRNYNILIDAQSKQTTFEQIEDELRSRIISGQIPGGARLHVDALRREFDVSTSTVREALSRLLTFSLVVSQPNIGFSVAPLSRKDCVAVAHTRELLEIEAMREALSDRNDAWESALAGAYHLLAKADRKFILEGDVSAGPEWRRRNHDFHEAMVATCQNRYIMDFRRSLNFNSERYRAILPKVSQTATHVPEQHRKLFEFAVDGKIEDCLAVMRDHISTTVALVIDHLPE